MVSVWRSGEGLGLGRRGRSDGDLLDISGSIGALAKPCGSQRDGNRRTEWCGSCSRCDGLKRAGASLRRIGCSVQSFADTLLCRGFCVALRLPFGPILGCGGLRTLLVLLIEIWPWGRILPSWGSFGLRNFWRFWYCLLWCICICSRKLGQLSDALHFLVAVWCNLRGRGCLLCLRLARTRCSFRLYFGGVRRLRLHFFAGSAWAASRSGGRVGRAGGPGRGCGRRHGFLGDFRKGRWGWGLCPRLLPHWGAAPSGSLRSWAMRWPGKFHARLQPSKH